MTDTASAGPQRPRPTPDSRGAEDRLVVALTGVNRLAVRVLAVLMTLVILLMVVDVGRTLWQELMKPPMFILSMSDLFGVFGAFIAVLIAIEIFINITIYLQERLIHVQIVMATALMAIARKVIVIDFERLDPAYIWSTAAVVLAMSVGYWLVMNNGSPKAKTGEGRSEKGEEGGER